MIVLKYRTSENQERAREHDTHSWREEEICSTDDRWNARWVSESARPKHGASRTHSSLQEGLAQRYVTAVASLGGGVGPSQVTPSSGW